MKIFRDIVSLEKAMITKHMTAFFFKNGLRVQKKNQVKCPPPWVVGVTQQQLKPFAFENGSPSSTVMYFSIFVTDEMQDNSTHVQPRHL